MTTIESPVPDPGSGAKAPAITRDIYGMPAFATLLVADVAATVSWYTDGLGFINLFTIPGPDGSPALVHLRRWQFQDLLVRPSFGPGTPPVTAPVTAPVTPPGTAGSSLFLSFAAVYDEVEGLAERARAHGAGAVDGPTDTPWNTRDLTTTDPDGNTVVFTAGRPPELTDAAFSMKMSSWNADQGLSPNA
jgi:catechol 2,3-dioxygenase-like lactoylglutathione lyase family enzyme